MEPARGPALSFRAAVIAAICFLLALLAAPGYSAERPDTPVSPETAEEACAAIRTALNELAKAERAQAFALSLGSTRESSTTLIEARLAAVLDRTRRLRNVLRQVRDKASRRDSRIEQCTKMGYHALVEAEKLTTNVEELLRNRENGEASLPAGPVRSDAGPAPAAQP